jgi:hypothetical protein
MAPNQVWKSKETKSYILKIIGKNPNGTVKVTFDFGLTPKTTHNYTAEYLDQYYEYAGYESLWTDPWAVKPPEPVKSELDKAFEDLDPEKVLFGDYTKEEKVNVWKEVPKGVS